MLERLLLPRPRQLRLTGGSLSLEEGLSLDLRCDPEDVEAALDRLRRSLGELGVTLTADGGRPLRLEATPTYGPAEAYRLVIEPSEVHLLASDGTGLSHGVSTLDQWVRIHSGARRRRHLPTVEIEDAPAIAFRGVLLDISRSRVPTMTRLLELIDRLASWKINQLQLYMEHTFAYRGHEEVWEHASPITATEAKQLDEHCRQRHIELVPNQNSFGHFHRWLEHPRYRPLAECPEGITHPFSDRPGPFSLCPIDPGSVELLADLYAQLLPSFSSRQLHVGFDETIDLGRGRSRARAQEVGPGEVYANFLTSVHGLAAQHNRRIQFWGDIVAKRPEILEHVPRDAIVMDWGYESDHPFAARARDLAIAGFDFYLCPGTSSWLSLAGRLSNAMANISAAVKAAVDHRAAGVLVTDWGDQGHLQPPSVAAPGVLAAAALAWNPLARTPNLPDTLDAAQLVPLLDLHAFGARPGEGPARGLVELAELYRLPGGSTFNGSPLFYLLTQPDLPLDHSRLRGLTAKGLEDCRSAIGGLPAPSDDPAGREIRWVRDAVDAGARLGIERLTCGAATSVRELPATRRAALADSLTDLLEGHRRIWEVSSRPGGLAESAEVLERMRTALAAAESPPTSPDRISR